MPTINVKIEQKRPLDATPERAVEMLAAGIKNKELAKLWNITPSRVSALVRKGRETKAKENTSPATE